jgi:hypothetical protein
MLDEAMDSTEEDEEDERRATTPSSPRSPLRLFNNWTYSHTKIVSNRKQHVGGGGVVVTCDEGFRACPLLTL